MRRLLPLLALSLALATRASAAPIGTSAPACTKPTATSQVFARASLVKAYQPRAKGFTLEVAFPACTSVPGPIGEVIFETGAGHSMGAALRIDRLERSGTAWNITVLEIQRGRGSGKKWGDEKPNGVVVKRGTITTTSITASIDDAIGRANTLLDATLSEKGPTGIFGAWGSSGDFYSAITMIGGGKVERRFAGYRGSTDQLTYLPIQVAVDKLDEVVPDSALTASTFDAPARSLFVARFLAEAPTFEDDYHWWVREAYIGAAGDAGDATLLPKLAEYTKWPTGKASNERTRVAAINAIVTLTGDDRRFDAKGAERSVDDVAKDYAKKPAKKP